MKKSKRAIYDILQNVSTYQQSVTEATNIICEISDQETSKLKDELKETYEMYHLA